MSAELPTKAEHEAYMESLRGHFKKGAIACGVMLTSGFGSLAFPPAAGGSVVGIVEATRQGILFNLEVIKHHKKYPGIDKR